MRRSPIRHALQLAGITVLVLACMFYPFMPGPHDRLATTLSSMVQALGFTGLLLVPIGVFWLAYELRALRARRHWFAFAALIASAVVAAGVTLVALIQTGPSLAVVVVILWGVIVRRALAGVRRMRMAGVDDVSPVPVYLIVVPIILVLARMTLLPFAVDVSRTRTIDGSATFIRAIEAYRAAHGRYPISLASVHHDYDPPTVGVERYHYEPYGLAYNVFFEQPTFPIGTQEFVMYNPLDEHAMMVHNQDLLEAPPGQVDRERAFHARAARETGVARWKYFWFD